MVALTFNEPCVGQDHIQARCRVIAEGDPQIDHQPLSTIVEQVEVHADFIGTPEGKEMKRFRVMRHERHPRGGSSDG